MSWLRSSFSGLSGAELSHVSQSLHLVLSKLKEEPKVAVEALECLSNEDFLKYLESNANNEDFLLLAFFACDETLKCLSDQTPSTEDPKPFELIGKTVITLNFMEKSLCSSRNLTLFSLTSLNLLSRIIGKSTHFVHDFISELLGVARAHVCFGIEITKLQKVLPTQQSYYDSSTEEAECESGINGQAKSIKGGKILRKRKPRSLALSLQKEQQNRWRSIAGIEYDLNEIRTSDSEISETEGNHEINSNERQKRAKVRLSAISLLGIIFRRLKDHRTLYNYWHGFFENTKVQMQCDRNQPGHRRDLLYIAKHDPNTRCRTAALQIAAQMIFTSKNFLKRAEFKEESCPTAFLPFAYNLGLQILSIYEDLIEILAKESSISVLIQACKVLAVLVQATSFENFVPSPFVGSFVKQVQRLTQHKDPTVQVAALMVMEFLIYVPELTSEISLALEIPFVKRKSKPNQHSKNDMEESAEIDNCFEEFIESESEDFYDRSTDKHKINEIPDSSPDSIQLNFKMDCKINPSWLLQCVFKNLSSVSAPAASVRIESLQVLCAMAQHLVFIQTQLNDVGTCLKNALNDSLIDVRICGARCLDTIAYQINMSMLEITTSDNYHTQNLLEENSKFWEQLLPSIIELMRKSSTENTSPVKVHLCDALSNMGTMIFERQSYAQQMNLIGLLSGIASDPNDDMSVRSAAVRALAVYVLFPSLRSNLVLVENTAELALRLVSDSNVLVRIKASWALANITTALLVNLTDNSNKERISDDLLFRLIVAVTTACDDKHKVRCNAVRTLGNLLCLLGPAHLDNCRGSQRETRLRVQAAILKLIDCLRLSGPAKVKWNTCYVIGNLLRKCTILNCINFDWQSKLFPTIANIIVHNPNFKVRINAATSLCRISDHSYIAGYFELLWMAILDAVDQSYHLNNFYEYNHQYQLQERLCLALSHLLKFCLADDFITAQKSMEMRLEVVQKTWVRVVNRIAPEKSAWLLSCVMFLQQKLNEENSELILEQRNSINFILNLLKTQ